MSMSTLSSRAPRFGDPHPSLCFPAFQRPFSSFGTSSSPAWCTTPKTDPISVLGLVHRLVDNSVLLEGFCLTADDVLCRYRVKTLPKMGTTPSREQLMTDFTPNFRCGRTIK